MLPPIKTELSPFQNYTSLSAVLRVHATSPELWIHATIRYSQLYLQF